jgi:hypothetical protein
MYMIVIRSTKLRSFKLPPECKWDFCSSEILRSVNWYLVTEVSGQPLGAIIKGQADQEFPFFDRLALKFGTNMLRRNVGVYQSTLRNI